MNFWWLLIILIENIFSEQGIEQFRSPDFSNSSEWNLMVNDRRGYFCKQDWCYLPAGWELALNQNVILFTHPSNFLVSCFQIINITSLNNPSVSLWLRILPEDNSIWPDINFTWNNLIYPIDFSLLNSSSDNYQELFLNEFVVDIPGKIAGIQIQTNNRTLLISRLSLTSVTSIIPDESLNNSLSSNDSLNSNEFVLSTSDIIALFVIGFFGMGIIVIIAMIVIHYGRRHRQLKTPPHILFHDQL